MILVSLGGLAIIGYAMYLLSEYFKRKQEGKKFDESFKSNRDRNN